MEMRNIINESKILLNVWFLIRVLWRVLYNFPGIIISRIGLSLNCISSLCEYKAYKTL